MGRPKFQSDVFSAGLVLYRLLSGKLPEWPFKWPMDGHDRLQARVRPEIAGILRKAIQLDPARRYRNAIEMYAEFTKLQKRARRQRKPVQGGSRRRAGKSSTSWRRLQWREFQRQYRKELDTRHDCRRCDGPVAESMQSCPWCGVDNPSRGCDTRMPSHCPRCERGAKLDWHYCAWCYGPGFEEETTRRFSDKRYSTRCANQRCREPLMPFMRYCPWCRSKVKKPWKITGNKEKCRSCKWVIVREYWNYCAWCREPVRRAR